MRPRESRAEETDEWLRLAARDLRVAELALHDAEPLIGEALFHAQQAAEKALKGFLVWRRAAYPLTHDIRRLLERCSELDPSLDTALAEVVDLTQFAVRFRYPGEDEPNIDEARQWMASAIKAYQEVRARIAGETNLPLFPRPE